MTPQIKLIPLQRQFFACVLMSVGDCKCWRLWCGTAASISDAIPISMKAVGYACEHMHGLAPMGWQSFDLKTLVEALTRPAGIVKEETATSVTVEKQTMNVLLKHLIDKKDIDLLEILKGKNILPPEQVALVEDSIANKSH